MCKSFNESKFKTLKPSFKKDGSITAANGSNCNDGAASLLLMEEDYARECGMKPLARVIAFEDASCDALDFCIANVPATKQLLQRVGMKINDIDFHEINEAFSAVAIANMKLLDLDHAKVNVHGGAVSLGHPIGCSGARIIVSLLNVLRARDGTLGLASICEGGGGASAVLLERLS